MAVGRLSPLRSIPILIAALAAWVSAGALSFASSHGGAARIGVLPSGLWLASCVAIAIVCGLTIRGAWTAALSLAVVLLLPWLPFPVPTVFYMWAGQLRVWVWILIAAMAAASFVRAHTPAMLGAWLRDPRRAVRVAAVAAVLLYAAGAYQVSPRLPGGDEPHYLVIAESLLTDHDLKVENNYLRGDYHAYFSGFLRPDYLRRGLNGEIYSIHAPGLPAIVAPVFALFGYRGVIALLVLIAGCASALAWSAAWRATNDAAAAWFGWASTALSMPFFFQSFVVYPEALGAAVVMVGVLALMEEGDASVRRLAWTGAALAVLPWLHLRLAVLAASLGVLLAVRQLRAPNAPRRIAALLAVPAVSAACWFAFFFVIYGTFDPRAPYGGAQQSALANVPRGLMGLAFDQQYGALPNAPVYLCGALGFFALFRMRTRLAVELLVLLLPYSLLVSGFDMWWGGGSSAARFLTPVLLLLAIPAAAWFRASRGRPSRVLGLGALAVSLLVTATVACVDRGALLYSPHDGASRLLRWLSPLVDLTKGAPSLFQNDASLVLLHAIIWLAAIGLTALIGRAIAARTKAWTVLAAGVALTAAVCAMVAVSIVWRSNKARAVTAMAGNVALLRALGEPRMKMAVQYPPFERLSPVDVPNRLVIGAFPAIGAEPADPATDAFIDVPEVPAATYAVDVAFRQPAAGLLSVVIDRKFGPAWQWDLSGANGSARREFRLPVPAAAIAIGGDASARSAIASVTLRAVALPKPVSYDLDREPWHVLREGPNVVFVMDGGRGYVEPGGVWVGGSAFLDLVVSPDDPDRPVRLFVRNPPVGNLIAIDGGEWRRSIAFKPGEEQEFEIPLPAGRQSLPLHIAPAHGARPFDFERGSSDTRLLGCWLEVR